MCYQCVATSRSESALAATANSRRIVQRFLTREGAQVAYSRLRVYYGPREAQRASGPAPQRVTIPLGDILSALADAQRQNRAWIQDFLGDEITISSDLYEVLLAYQHYRRPAG
jgi:hypothetical protein